MARSHFSSAAQALAPHASESFAVRRRASRLTWLGLLIAGLAAGCASSVAAPEFPQDDFVDPPARVGSVSALRGPVDTTPDPGTAWQPARLNQPVTSATALWAPPGSQAEVRIGSSSVRLDGNTQAAFTRLDDDEVIIDVTQGTVRARLRRLDRDDRFVLVIDGVRAVAQGPGDYRASYDPQRRTATVRAVSGRMSIAAPSNSFNLEAGQETVIEGGGAALQLRAAGPRDDFDAWAEGRDREQDRLASARYVSPETTGIEALDAHGRWEVVGDYGPVWYPRALPYGWAPYRYGHWAQVRPWGWTWIDDAPWGFAPFHYGRWSQIGGAWGWIPGPIVARPVWAPALVGYVGGGRGGVSVSIGIGGGPVGWFPLGPGELYYPPYRYSPRYGRHVHHGHAHHFAPPPSDGRWATRQPVPGAPAYRYAQRPDAVTMVREDQFRGGRSLGNDRMVLTPQQAAGLQPVMVVPGAGGNSSRRGPGDGRSFDPARPAPSARGDSGRGEIGRSGEVGRGEVGRGDGGRGAAMPDRVPPAAPWPAYGDRNPRPGVDGSARPAPVPVPNVGAPPPFERAAPSTGRDLIRDRPGQPARGDGGRGDPRFADEPYFDRGRQAGRSAPQVGQPAMPTQVAPVMPAPPPVRMPAPAAVPMPMPQAPQAAPVRPPPAPAVAPRSGREPREPRDGAAEGPQPWRPGGGARAP